MTDYTMINWLVFTSMNETWAVFTKSDVLLSFLGGAGLASIFVVMIVALSKIELDEKALNRFPSFDLRGVGKGENLTKIVLC